MTAALNIKALYFFVINNLEINEQRLTIQQIPPHTKHLPKDLSVRNPNISAQGMYVAKLSSLVFLTWVSPYVRPQTEIEVEEERQK